MSRFFSRRVQVEPAKPDLKPPVDDRASDGTTDSKLQSSNSNAAEDQEQLNSATEDQEPLNSVAEDQEQLNSVTEDQEQSKEGNSPREVSPQEADNGDYIGVQSRPYIRKILEKQGDKKILFADKVLKYTCSGKLKRRLLLITDFALYIVDPETDSLRRRIALAAVEKLCLSKLKDNFFAIIIPTEYDLLMASTRKTEIATVLVDATKSASDYELEVSRSDSFEYNAAAEIVKEVQFEEVEGGIKMRVVKK
ncbi:uncharacterized protein LOC127259999 [Andrographis paniculata]|uniref:uncharacterized protein LOC127259999 n=1 Tax=Andrographis paniculata TaxID=175694 RepID=UPI0021E7C39E|nr:uncharacterized protein LOC127259999 [Andrographis paniculata]